MPRWGDVEISDGVQNLIVTLQDYQSSVAQHRMYSELCSLSKVRMFMETHVFAVWDFMSLLTAIRSRLTCTAAPWLPKGTGEARRFVNELFLAEDSDLHPNGDRYTSHFELYLEAMKAAGANTAAIDRFTKALQSGMSLRDALILSDAPEAACRFVEGTWRVITEGSLAELLGAFTFGRESVIPSMFSNIRRLAVEVNELDLFVAYLDRHIELDGDEHAPVAFRMVSAICDHDTVAWQGVLNGGRNSLTARSGMWDSLYERLREHDSSIASECEN